MFLLRKKKRNKNKREKTWIALKAKINFEGVAGSFHKDVRDNPAWRQILSDKARAGYEAVGRGSIKIRGKPIDLKPVVEATLGKLASAISSEVERVWADDWDIDLMVISGGGGALLAPYLEPLLSGEVLPRPSEGDPRMQNVRGYWKYGNKLWGREIKAKD